MPHSGAYLASARATQHRAASTNLVWHVSCSSYYPHMPLSGGQAFAGYRILRLLGSGGMGEVYLAEHPRLPRHNTLKVLPTEVSADPNYRARFEREADLASKLWHPHIVSVHDRGEHEGQLWRRCARRGTDSW